MLPPSSIRPRPREYNIFFKGTWITCVTSDRSCISRVDASVNKVVKVKVARACWLCQGEGGGAYWHCGRGCPSKASKATRLNSSKTRQDQPSFATGRFINLYRTTTNNVICFFLFCILFFFVFLSFLLWFSFPFFTFLFLSYFLSM